MHNVLSSSTAIANRLCSFPGSLTIFAFFLLEAFIFIDDVVSSDDPRHWNRTWDCCCSCRCHLLLPTMSRPYHECALAFTSMVRGNDDHPPLEPANLCDATIGNEFPESDKSPFWTVAFWCRIKKDAYLEHLPVVQCRISTIHNDFPNGNVTGHVLQNIVLSESTYIVSGDRRKLTYVFTSSDKPTCSHAVLCEQS